MGSGNSKQVGQKEVNQKKLQSDKGQAKSQSTFKNKEQILINISSAKQIDQSANKKQINDKTKESLSETSQDSKILIERYINCARNTLTQWKQDPTISQVIKMNNSLNQNYLKPINEIYRQIPQQLTTMKFSYLNCYDYQQRLTALSLASAIVGIATFRRNKIYQLPLNSLSALRDAAVTYFVGGLVIAPQIYNPFMKQ